MSTSIGAVLLTLSQVQTALAWTVTDSETHTFLPYGRVKSAGEPSFTYMPVEDPEALNLDGSRYAIAVCLANNSDEWRLYAEGGGWCYDEDDCAHRASTGLGSNSSWPGIAQGMRCDPSGTVNYGYFYYGDGASRTGYRAEPWPVPSNPSQKLYFRGVLSLYSGLDLLLKLGMNKAKRIVYEGGSAGGLTVFLSLDRVAAMLAVRAPNALVVGYIISGYFADFYTKFPGRMNYMFEMQNSSGGVPEACLEAHPAPNSWKCVMAPYSAPLIKTPWFAAQSRFDLASIMNILTYPADTTNQIPCLFTPNTTCNTSEIEAIVLFGQKFMEQFSPLITAPGSLNGGYLDQCYQHCQFAVIDGVSMPSAFEQWFANIQQVVTPGGARAPLDFKRWWTYNCGGSYLDGPCAAHDPPNGGTMDGCGTLPLPEQE